MQERQGAVGGGIERARRGQRLFVVRPVPQRDAQRAGNAASDPASTTVRPSATRRTAWGPRSRPCRDGPWRAHAPRHSRWPCPRATPRKPVQQRRPLNAKPASPVAGPARRIHTRRRRVTVSLSRRPRGPVRRPSRMPSTRGAATYRRRRTDRPQPPRRETKAGRRRGAFLGCARGIGLAWGRARPPWVGRRFGTFGRHGCGRTERWTRRRAVLMARPNPTASGGGAGAGVPAVVRRETRACVVNRGSKRPTRPRGSAARTVVTLPVQAQVPERPLLCQAQHSRGRIAQVCVQPKRSNLAAQDALRCTVSSGEASNLLAPWLTAHLTPAVPVAESPAGCLRRRRQHRRRRQQRHHGRRHRRRRPEHRRSRS